MQSGTVSRLRFLQEILRRIQNLHQVEHCAFSEAIRFSWMCKNQISVPHSSTEAEVISLDACLRMDGIPALDLWDSVIKICHSSPNKTNKIKDVRELLGNLSANLQPNVRKQIPHTNTNLDLTNIDHVPSNETHSGPSAMLYVFEDNEAVIKMIIKGRSPTMRHVFQNSQSCS